MNVQDRSNTFDLNKYGVGQPVRRTEDPVLVQGQGRYTDDMNLAGQAHAVFVRSPLAHARICAVDLSRAAVAPGVELALSGPELAQLVPPVAEYGHDRGCAYHRDGRRRGHARRGWLRQVGGGCRER